MATSRYPRQGFRLAPAMLRGILEVPLSKECQPNRAHGPLMLCDLDETAWTRFGAETCQKLACQIVRTVASKIRTPDLGGERILPPLPSGWTLADLDLESRTINCLQAAGLQQRPQDLLRDEH